MKVRSLKNRMSSFTEVVGGLKEGKKEMTKQVQELDAAIDTLMAKIKVGGGGRGQGFWPQRRRTSPLGF